jgi:hypothetical protein
MKTQSKALLTLLMIIGTNAYASNKLIERAALGPDQIDPTVLKELLMEKVLLLSKLPQFFELNEKKVEEIIVNSNGPELTEFMNWLKSLAGDGTQVNQKKPGEMTPASQDIKGTM